MNREIKFRKWHKELKDMTYSENVFISFFMTYEKYPDMYELMQNTGIKDRTGKDIYQGDILKSVQETIFLVVWSIERCAFFLQTKEGEIYTLEQYMTPNLWVESNIYQNPEMIKVAVLN